MARIPMMVFRKPPAIRGRTRPVCRTAPGSVRVRFRHPIRNLFLLVVWGSYFAAAILGTLAIQAPRPIREVLGSGHGTDRLQTAIPRTTRAQSARPVCTLASIQHGIPAAHGHARL